jgi:epoxyqueuosine reductase
MDYAELANDIKRWGRELGFQQVGITDVDLDAYEPAFREWLSRGFHGSMQYMERHADKRLDPGALVPGTVRVICARMDYLAGDTAPVRVLEQPEVGYVSRYALGRDYHKLVRGRLGKLAARINETAGGGALRAFADSAPVLEKPLAEKAGLGWIGKHSLVLTRDAGSWFFLGEVFTNLPLPIDPPATESHCGRCRACINVCPTGAIVGERQLDARRCISYLTIELKGAIPEALRPQIGQHIFGCDICQDVCPWNRFQQISSEPGFAPREGTTNIEVNEILQLTPQSYATRFRRSPMKRAKLKGLQLAYTLCHAAGCTAETAQPPTNRTATGSRTPVTMAVIVSPGMPKTNAGIQALPSEVLFAEVLSTIPSTVPLPNFSGLLDSFLARL